MMCNTDGWLRGGVFGRLQGAGVELAGSGGKASGLEEDVTGGSDSQWPDILFVLVALAVFSLAAFVCRFA